jgi:hypothetical protein
MSNDGERGGQTSGNSGVTQISQPTQPIELSNQINRIIRIGLVGSDEGNVLEFIINGINEKQRKAIEALLRKSLGLNEIKLTREREMVKQPIAGPDDNILLLLPNGLYNALKNGAELNLTSLSNLLKLSNSKGTVSVEAISDRTELMGTPFADMVIPPTDDDQTTAFINKVWDNLNADKEIQNDITGMGNLFTISSDNPNLSLLFNNKLQALLTKILSQTAKLLNHLNGTSRESVKKKLMTLFLGHLFSKFSEYITASTVSFETLFADTELKDDSDLVNLADFVKQTRKQLFTDDKTPMQIGTPPNIISMTRNEIVQFINSHSDSSNIKTPEDLNKYILIREYIKDIRKEFHKISEQFNEIDKQETMYLFLKQSLGDDFAKIFITHITSTSNGSTSSNYEVGNNYWMSDSADTTLRQVLIRRLDRNDINKYLTAGANEEGRVSTLINAIDNIPENSPVSNNNIFLLAFLSDCSQNNTEANAIFNEIFSISNNDVETKLDLFKTIPLDKLINNPQTLGNILNLLLLIDKHINDDSVANALKTRLTSAKNLIVNNIQTAIALPSITDQIRSTYATNLDDLTLAMTNYINLKGFLERVNITIDERKVSDNESLITNPRLSKLEQQIRRVTDTYRVILKERLDELNRSIRSVSINAMASNGENLRVNLRTQIVEVQRQLKQLNEDSSTIRDSIKIFVKSIKILNNNSKIAANYTKRQQGRYALAQACRGLGKAAIPTGLLLGGAAAIPALPIAGLFGLGAGVAGVASAGYSSLRETKFTRPLISSEIALKQAELDLEMERKQHDISGTLKSFIDIFNRHESMYTYFNDKNIPASTRLETMKTNIWEPLKDLLTKSSVGVDRIVEQVRNTASSIDDKAPIDIRKKVTQVSNSRREEGIARRAMLTALKPQSLGKTVAKTSNWFAKLFESLFGIFGF